MRYPIDEKTKKPYGIPEGKVPEEPKVIEKPKGEPLKSTALKNKK